MLLHESMKSNSLITSNLKKITAQSCGSAIARPAAAGEACQRLIQAMSVLPEDAYFGWQIRFTADEPQSFAFTGADTHISQTDYDWIFNGFASAEPLSEDALSSLCEENSHVYALQYQPSHSDDDDSFDDDPAPGYAEVSGSLKAFWEELKSLQPTIRFLVTGNREKTGVMLLFLKEELSLRMQIILATAFLYVKAIEFTNDCNPWLPCGCFASAMQAVMRILMLDAFNRERANNPESAAAEANGPSEYDDVPLEDLNLSVRSYNCLKRYGIDTVGELRELSDRELMSVRNLGKKCVDEIKWQLSKLLSGEGESNGGLAGSSLNELIGLEDVKRQVRRIAAFARMNRDLKERSGQSIPLVLNMEFVGNPGTAKTTVARILAGIFREVGLLKSGAPVEVGRADLIARYEGQTAEQVKRVFRSAKGKLLFIDEAYSLLESHEGEYGDEAISTIVQEMENHRDETIVIFAGYPDKMEAFFARNPGLRSRVPFQIRFPDYTADEMVQIVELEAKRRGFQMSSDARERVAAVCADAQRSVDSGNGRFCRNLVENAVLCFAERAYGEGSTPVDCDFVLSGCDFPAVESKRVRKTAPIGFRSEPA